MSDTDQTAAALFHAGRLDDAMAIGRAARREGRQTGLIPKRAPLGEPLAFRQPERPDAALTPASAIDPKTLSGCGCPPGHSL
jgi:hypothetical protein